MLERRCPFYHRLPEPDRRELEGHIQVFLDEKHFEGCAGLRVTEEMKLCIAAQACLLLLHRDTDYYPELWTILIYPSTYFAPSVRHAGSGIWEEMQQERAGESWPQGAVVLAWDEVRRGTMDPERGHHIVLHEFAHQLDFEDGYADGAPVLGRGEGLLLRKSRYAAWARVLSAEFARLRDQLEHGERGVLDDYAATNPAEFFAVATESFFGKPREMRQKHLELYEQLKTYYRQDPALWSEGPQAG